MQGTVEPKEKGKGQLKAMNYNNCGAYVLALSMLRLWLRGELKHRLPSQPPSSLFVLFNRLD